MLIIENSKILVNEQQSLERNSAIIRKYHKSIAFANKENKLSPYDGWQQIKSSMSLFSLLYKNRIKYSKWSTNRNNYIKLALRELRQFNSAVRQQKSENHNLPDMSEIDNEGRY